MKVTNILYRPGYDGEALSPNTISRRASDLRIGDPVQFVVSEAARIQSYYPKAHGCLPSLYSGRRSSIADHVTVGTMKALYGVKSAGLA